VACPEGKKVLGGGAFVAEPSGISSDEAVLSSSRSFPDGSRWAATTARLRTGVMVNGDLTVWAICANVTP
jgi:hypothetical protein